MDHKALYRAVLVPLDGSDLAEQALGPARWLAANLGAGLYLITADVHPRRAVVVRAVPRRHEPGHTRHRHPLL